MGMAVQGAFESNRRLNRREYEEGRTILESWPVDLMMILTTRCNHQCIHCSREVSGKVLPEEAAFKVASLFPYLRFLNLQGGEAFLAPYFRRLVERAAMHPNIRKHVQTAGTLITKELADFLVRMDMDLSFSIDGATKETYERIRKPAKFERLLQSLDFVNDACARLGKRREKNLCVTVMRSNYRELELFIDFGKKHGFTSVQFWPIAGGGERPAQPEGGAIYYQPEENIFFHEDAAALRFLRAAKPRVEELARASPMRLEWTLTAPEAAKPASRTSPASPERPDIACVRPWRMLQVNAALNGDVFPDCYCSIPAGNLARDSVSEIWNGPVMQKYRALLVQKRTGGFCSEPCVSGLVDPLVLSSWR